MSYESAMQRVSELNSLLGGRSAVASRPASSSESDAAAFAAAMAQAQGDEHGAAEGEDAASTRTAGRTPGMQSLTATVLPGGAVGGSAHMPSVGYPPAAPVLPAPVPGLPVAPAPAGAVPGMPLGSAPTATPTFPAPAPAPAYPLPMPVPTPTVPGLGGVGGAAPVAWPPASGVGQKIVQLARQELGVREAPSGSNESPRIREYRTATAGAENTPGPWCAYFVSWLCKEAGAPIGSAGKGTGYVPSLESWGRSSGKWVDAAQRPKAGDIAIFNWGGSGVSDHTGIVERVAPDGTVHTIEGNSSNMVTRRSYPAGSVHVKGFVRAA